MKPEEIAFLNACKKSRIDVRPATKKELKCGLCLYDDDNIAYNISKDKNAEIFSIRPIYKTKTRTETQLSRDVAIATTNIDNLVISKNKHTTKVASRTKGVCTPNTRRLSQFVGLLKLDSSSYSPTKKSRIQKMLLGDIKISTNIQNKKR